MSGTPKNFDQFIDYNLLLINNLFEILFVFIKV